MKKELFVLALLAACDDGGRDRTTPDEADTARADTMRSPEAGPDDGALPADRVLSLADLAAADGSLEPDQGPLVPDCETTCAQYDQCSLTEDVFVTRAACDTICADAADEGLRWRDCVRRADCDGLVACPVPSQPELSCGGVCDEVERCEGPIGDPECRSLCESAAAPAVITCGEHLRFGLCDGEAFAGCVVEAASPICEANCEVAPGCGFTTPSNCAADCLSALGLSDGLARERAEQLFTCIGSAPDCERAAVCVERASTRFDRATFCQRFDGCGFPDLFGPCADFLRYSFPQPLSHTVELCLHEGLTDPCPPIDAISNCLGGDQAPPDCAGSCHAHALCGTLPAGQAEEECVQACSVRVQGLDAQALAFVLDCGRASETCEAFQDCQLERAPETRCASACGRAVVCGADENEVDCTETCSADFVHPAWRDWLACVEADLRCEAVATCPRRLPIGCEEQCARRRECDANVDAATCVRACQDIFAGDRITGIVLAACVLGASSCGDPAAELEFQERDSLALCERDFPASGGSCPAHCRARVECRGRPDDEMVACLTSCGDPASDTHLEMLAGLGCYLGYGPFAACPNIVSCAPDLASLDCRSLCGAKDACGLGTVNCLDECENQPLSRLRALQQAGCVEAAGDCEALSVCLSGPVVVEAVDVRTFCEAVNSCPNDVGLTCEEMHSIGLASGGPGSTHCVMDILSRGCPASANVYFEQCFIGQAIEPSCTADCVVQELCLDGDERVSAARCAEGCFVFAPGPVAEVRQNAILRPCHRAGTCLDFEACVVARSNPAACETFCESRVACGADAAACAAECDDRYLLATHTAYRDCVSSAGGDCVAVEACGALAQAPFCDLSCAHAADCIGPNDDCRLVCDSLSVTDPIAAAEQSLCVGFDVACGPGFRECFAAPPVDACARACQADLLCGSPRAFEACIAGCASSLDPERAVLVAAAAPCLLAAEPTCEALTACLEAAAVLDPDCNAVCPAISACGLELDAPCIDVCANAVQAGCVLDVTRRNAGCIEVARCVGVEVPEPSADCVAYCGRYQTCTGEDPFGCYLECTPEPLGLSVRAECALVTQCGQVDACADLGPVPPDGCAGSCAAARACGAFADDAACLDTCAGRAQSPTASADYLQDLDACTAGLGDPCAADAALACFEFAGGCIEACAILAECFPPEPGCVDGCERANIEDPALNALVIACVFSEIGAGQCDLNAVMRCFEDAPR